MKFALASQLPQAKGSRCAGFIAHPPLAVAAWGTISATREKGLMRAEVGLPTGTSLLDSEANP